MSGGGDALLVGACPGGDIDGDGWVGDAAEGGHKSCQEQQPGGRV